MSRKALVVKLLALALALDLLGRAAMLLAPGGYEAAAREALSSDVCFVFAGSSRVAAAIDPGAFVGALPAREGERPTAVNVGRGYHTVAEDYFGLRMLADARPGGLRNVVVLIEAPMDVPALSTWSDSWVHPAYPELLSQVMSVSDLPRFWRESATEPGVKTAVTLSLLFPEAQLLGKGTDLVGAALLHLERSGLLPRRGPDLSQAGGVLVDDAAVQRTRAFAVRFVEDAIVRQRPVSHEDLSRTALRSVVDLVRERGGRVALFRMPVSTVFEAPHRTAFGEANRSAAARALADWDVPVLVPDMTTTDDDFPDLWHMRTSRAAEYSRSLARAYADWERRELNRRGR